MRRISSRLLLAATAALLPVAIPSVSSGQESYHRTGFWIRGGPTVGVDESGRWGPGGYVGLGMTLNPHFLLGGQAFLFEADIGRQGDPKTRTNFTVALLAYPSERGGTFFKIGMGYATEQFSALLPQSTEVARVTDGRFGANLGVGYDLRLADGPLTLTPSFDALLGFYGDGLDNPDASFLLTVGWGCDD